MPGPPEHDAAAEREYPCEMCGQIECECPECSNCGAFGDPTCYREHGMAESEHQRIGRDQARESREGGTDVDLPY